MEAMESIDRSTEAGSTDPARTEAGGRLPSRREVLSLGVGIFVVSAIPIVRRSSGPALVRRRIPAMGTVAEVSVLHRDARYAQRAIDAALDQIRRSEDLLTRFRPDSDVGRVNAAPPGSAVDVESETGWVLDAALELASLTGGLFDPCLGRATELWDVGARSAPPAEPETAVFASRRFHRELEVDRSAGRTLIRAHAPGLAIDLGGIGKGWGVDRAVRALRDWGITDGLVNLGGDLYALGSSPNGDPWLVGVRDPDDPAGVVARLPLSDGALATSGDYERFFVHAGRRYHHVLDPRTGRPFEGGTRSVTVADHRCWRADAVATALFGAAPEQRQGLLKGAVPGARLVHHISEPGESTGLTATPRHLVPAPAAESEDPWKGARPSAATATSRWS